MVDKIKIIGGNKINGFVDINGAKNAVLPIVISSILSKEKLVLNNIPKLLDMNTSYDILKELGAHVDIGDNQVVLNGNNINNVKISYDLASSMRASVLVLGPLLARFKEAIVPLPGGCSIGLRPINLHVKALQSMGAEIEIVHGNIVAKAKNGLHGAEIYFNSVSVGATENIIMAAALAKGKTRIINAAYEPEVIDLVICLRKMGANIQGEGTSVIEIEGVSNLKEAYHTILPDRIEAGSYALAALVTNGEIVLNNFNTAIWGSFYNVLKNVGAEIIELSNNRVHIKSGKNINALDIITSPYPGFPTDLQSPFTALLSVASGKSTVRETIFENRFTHVPELIRMGAHIIIENSTTVIVEGVKKLSSAKVKATDLRSSFALIIAGLVAEGETVITQLHHLDRGYTNVVNNLAELGVNIKRGEHI